MFLLMAQAWAMLAQQAEDIVAPAEDTSGDSKQTTH
jgi:hypothetical protein